MLNNNLMLFFLTVFAFVLRLKFMSPWLEDWDSVQFAIAMGSYSLSEGIPHAPGYPLYILLSKFLFLFLHDHNLSLTFLSSLLGSFSVVPLYLLAKKMFDQKVALFSSLILIFSPVHWTLSEVALTNIPGLFFLLFWIYLLYKFMDSYKVKILLSALAGIILGVRFTEFPVIAALLLLVLFKKSDLKLVFFSFASFIIGLSLWMIPLIKVTGFKEFLGSYNYIAGYIFKHDAILGQESFGLKILLTKIESLWYLLKLGYTVPFILLGTLAILTLIKKKCFKKFTYLFLLVWLISYGIPLIFFYNLEVTRYTLPLLPPLAIILSAQAVKLIKNDLLQVLIFFPLLLLIFQQGFYQVSEFKNITPPIIESVLYVKNNFASHNTILIPAITYRHFQYYGNEFEVLDINKAPKDFSFGEKTVIIDFLGTKDKFNKLADFDVTEKKEFFGNKDLFNRVNKITIYILKPQ